MFADVFLHLYNFTGEKKDSVGHGSAQKGPKTNIIL
jgi:hypothetical protein